MLVSASDGVSMEMEVGVSTTARKGAQFRARLRGKEYKVELAQPVLYNLQQGAQAVALVYPDGPPRRFGNKTCHAAMRALVQGRVPGNPSLDDADPEMVELYRQKLVEFGVFPQEAADALEDDDEDE
jgi:hypothetical protein